MPERTSEIEWKLRAKDETGPAYDSARQRLEEFIHHSRETAHLLEHGLKLGGAGLIATLIGEALSKVGEQATQFAEELEKARTATERQVAEFHAMRNVAESLPFGIGALVKGIREFEDGINNAVAQELRARGASEETVDSWRTAENELKHYTELVEKQTEAINGLRESMQALGDQQLKFVGGPAAERQAAELEHNRRIAELVKERQKIESEVGEAGPDSAQKQMLASLRQRDLLERQRYQQELADIDHKTIDERNEATEKTNEAENERFHRQLIDQEQQQQKLADVQVQGAANRLRLQHQDAEADLLLLRQRHFDEAEEDRRALDEKIRTLHVEADARSRETGLYDQQEVDAEEARLRRDAQGIKNARDAAFQAEQAKLQQDARNQQLDEQAEREKTLASLRIDLLRQEGQLGNEEAKRAAELLALSEKYADKRNEINRLLREGHDIPQAERDQLQQMLKTLDAQEKQELARSAAGGDQTPANPFATGAQIAFGSTGSREAFAAGVRQNENDQRRQQQQMVDGILKSTDWLNKIWQLLNGAISGTGPASAGFSPANLGA